MRGSAIVRILILLLLPGGVFAATDDARTFVPVPLGSGLSSEIAEKANWLDKTAFSKNVDFWISIYTKYSSTQGVLHDAKYLDKVYEIIDLTGATPSMRRRMVREAKKRWRKALLGAHRNRKNPEKMTEDELKVFRLFQGMDEPDKYQQAALRRRMRYQLGQRDFFLQGLIDSGKYMAAIEEVFRKEGLPVELTRLALVESSFNMRAKSKVGAAGIWQLMRSTGRLYLKVNDSIDERLDPIRASEAAAKILKTNYESLGSWPLAVTAYNYGRNGLKKAVEKHNADDLSGLLKNRVGRRFGFASSNFFMELLAAIEVEKNSRHYFGEFSRAPAHSFYEVEIPDHVNLVELSKLLKLDLKAVRELNPALSERVLRGERRLSAKYKLRLPKAEGADGESEGRVFMAGYQAIPASFKISTRRVTSNARRVRVSRTN